MPAFSKSDWPVLAKSIGYVAAATALGWLFTSTGLGPWYDGLAKPPFTPPQWIFGPIWTLLYLLMIAALFLVWRQAGITPGACMATNVFFVQLALNAAWSFFFFFLRSPGLGLLELTLLLAATAWTLARFAAVSRLAAALFAPYAAWTAFAWLLNMTIWRMNG